MLIRRRITVLVALAGAVGALSAPWPARTATAVPAARGTRSTLAARVSAAAALPSGAGSQLVKDVQKATAVADGSGVTVAVLSTGVDPATPGLTGKVSTGPDFTGSAHPVKVVGTLVADMVAGNDSPANAGLAPAARILSIRTSEESTEPGSSAFYNNSDPADIDTRAIQYAVGHSARVIFIDSLVGGSPFDGPTDPLESAVHDAVAKNVVIVAIDAYFDSQAGWDYPSSLPGVIGVGSVTLAGLPAPMTAPGRCGTDPC